jgi:hypothetical protein
MMTGWIFVHEATRCLMRGANERFLWHGYKAFGKRYFRYGVLLDMLHCEEYSE